MLEHDRLGSINTLAHKIYCEGLIDILIQAELELVLKDSIAQLERYLKIPFEEVTGATYQDIVYTVTRCRSCINLLRYYTTNTYYAEEEKVDKLAQRMEVE